MFERTYQHDPIGVTHPDIAEQYRRSLMAYRRASNQDPEVGRTLSYFRQNQRGPFWLAVAAIAASLVYLITTKGKKAMTMKMGRGE